MSSLLHTLSYLVIEYTTAIVVELYHHQITPHFLQHPLHTDPTHPIRCIYFHQRGSIRRLETEKPLLAPPIL